MSVRRGAVSSTIAGDNIYVSNGYKDSDGNATIIEKYSIKDNRWSVINSTLVPKRFANSETYNNKIYIINLRCPKHYKPFQFPERFSLFLQLQKKHEDNRNEN